MKTTIFKEKIYALTKSGKVWAYGNRPGANHHGKFINCSTDKEGYRRYAFRYNGQTIYKRIGRLMLETYNPTINKQLQTNHKNGIRNDDRLCNLEWVTPSENIKHSYKHLGKSQKGIKNNSFKPWGYNLNNKTILINNIPITHWVKQFNTISTSVIYKSIALNKQINRGMFKNYTFFIQPTKT